MSEYEMTAEEQEAWLRVERRLELSRANILRATDKPDQVDSNICECCGYPYLFYDVDFYDPCIICGWLPSVEKKPGDLLLDSDVVGRPLSLAAGRWNFEACGNCFGVEALEVAEAQKCLVERMALINALDELLVDGVAENDVKHWQDVRDAYEALVNKCFGKPKFDRWLTWGFAGERAARYE